MPNKRITIVAAVKAVIKDWLDKHKYLFSRNEITELAEMIVDDLQLDNQEGE